MWRARARTRAAWHSCRCCRSNIMHQFVCGQPLAKTITGKSSTHRAPGCSVGIIVFFSPVVMASIEVKRADWMGIPLNENPFGAATNGVFIAMASIRVSMPTSSHCCKTIRRKKVSKKHLPTKTTKRSDNETLYNHVLTTFKLFVSLGRSLLGPTVKSTFKAQPHCTGEICKEEVQWLSR